MEDEWCLCAKRELETDGLFVTPKILSDGELVALRAAADDTWDTLRRALCVRRTPFLCIFG